MAISFTRLDPSSPSAISAATFAVVRRGYDQAEVRDFLRMVAAEQARLQERERFLERELKALQQSKANSLDATDEAQRLREEAEIEAARRRQDASADSEAEISMAKQQGRDMVNEARAYRERVLSELARRREMARQQIEQLVHG